MITGRQIRDARALVNYSSTRLAKAAGLSLDTVTRAELVDTEAVITILHSKAIQRALESAGVEFTNGDQPGVKLKAKG